MPKNNKTVTENIIKVKAKLAEGKTQRETAKEVGLGKSRVGQIAKDTGQEWASVQKTDFIKSLVQKSFGNVDIAIDIETAFLNKIIDTDKRDLRAGDINIVSQIGERNQKRGSVLGGGNTDDKGGEKAIPILGGITNV